MAISQHHCTTCVVSLQHVNLHNVVGPRRLFNKYPTRIGNEYSVPVNVFKLKAGSDNDVHAKGQIIIKSDSIEL